jgi:hypothetical protein
MVKQDDFKTRLLIERLALDEKISKLHAFIGSEPYHKLENVDRFLLCEQLGNMQMYQETLRKRIDRLCGPEAELDEETIEEIKQESRFLKAIAATKELPDNWTLDVSYENDGGRVFLCDALGDSVPNNEIYDDFDTLPEQIENAIAYAKSYAAD